LLFVPFILEWVIDHVTNDIPLDLAWPLDLWLAAALGEFVPPPR